MAQQRDTPIMILSVDDSLDGLRAETDKLGSKVRWVTVSQELLDEILYFLAHPETGVRRERPERKEKENDPQP